MSILISDRQRKEVVLGQVLTEKVSIKIALLFVLPSNLGFFGRFSLNLKCSSVECIEQ